MVVNRATAPTLLLIFALLVPGGTAQAPEGLGFEVVIEDAADHVGFLDISELAMAEPGDGTVVFRLTVADAGLAPPAGSTVDLFFSTPTGDYREGVTPAGACGGAFQDAYQDGDSFFCVISYEKLGLGVGDTIGSMYVISYAGPAMDYAPGDTVGLSDIVLGGTSEYTLVGCTFADPAACPVAETESAAAMVFENLTAPSFVHAFDNATSDDYTLNFTVPWHNVTLSQTSGVVSGLANVTIVREGEVVAAFSLDNQTAPADGNSSLGAIPDSLDLSGLEGNWTVVIDYTDFVGTLGLTVEEFVEAPAVVETNATEEPTLDADAALEDAPGVALPLMALGLLGAVFVVRRRS